eukprot:Lankesteria_metandrocarpae@DN4395_c0_g1_i4.p1
MNPVYRKFGAWRPHNNAWKPNYATTNPPFTKSSGDHGQAWRPRNNAWEPNYATTNPPVVINPLPTSPPDTLSGVAELRALFENKKNEQWQGKPSYTPFTNTYGKPSYKLEYDDDNGRRHWGRGLDKTERVEVYESPVYNTFQEYRQRHN